MCPLRGLGGGIFYGIKLTAGRMKLVGRVKSRFAVSAVPPPDSLPNALAGVADRCPLWMIWYHTIRWAIIFVGTNLPS